MIMSALLPDMKDMVNLITKTKIATDGNFSSPGHKFVQCILYETTNCAVNPKTNTLHKSITFKQTMNHIVKWIFFKAAKPFRWEKIDHTLKRNKTKQSTVLFILVAIHVG